MIIARVKYDSVLNKECYLYMTEDGKIEDSDGFQFHYFKLYNRNLKTSFGYFDDINQLTAFVISGIHLFENHEIIASVVGVFDDTDGRRRKNFDLFRVEMKGHQVKIYGAYTNDSLEINLETGEAEDIYTNKYGCRFGVDVVYRTLFGYLKMNFVDNGLICKCNCNMGKMIGEEYEIGQIYIDVANLDSIIVSGVLNKIAYCMENIYSAFRGNKIPIKHILVTDKKFSGMGKYVYEENCIILDYEYISCMERVLIHEFAHAFHRYVEDNGVDFAIDAIDMLTNKLSVSETLTKLDSSRPFPTRYLMNKKEIFARSVEWCFIYHLNLERYNKNAKHFAALLENLILAECSIFTRNEIDLVSDELNILMSNSFVKRRFAA